MLRIGTRGSQLALAQAHAVAQAIQQHGGFACELVVIKTSGDRLADAPLAEVGGKRLFVKELEDALLSGSIDLAVHSSKDMPVVLPDGLTVGAVLPREDPRDALVLPERTAHADRTFEALVPLVGQTPAIGTGSVRRVAQLTRAFPHARFHPIRGNLDTRLRKLDGNEYDVLVLAAAGLRRLGYGQRISAVVPIEVCLPAAGQGAIAVEMRVDDERVRQTLEPIDDLTSAAALTAERALVARLGGGCQTPIGALAIRSGDELELRAVVMSLDGARTLSGHDRGVWTDPQALGTRLAEHLIGNGAVEILGEIGRRHAAVQGLQP